MSEAKFTKGPWTIEHDREFDECIIYAEREEDRVVICEVSTYVTVSNDDNCIDVDQIIANANLIAAAPDMYEALDHLRIVAQKVCDDFCCGAGCSQDARDCKLEGGLIRAEIALRKARGEEE